MSGWPLVAAIAVVWVLSAVAVWALVRALQAQIDARNDQDGRRG